MEPTQPSPTPYTPPITPAPSVSSQPPQQGTWKMPLAILIGVLVLAGGAYALLRSSPDPIAEQTPTPSAVGLPVSSPTASVPADWKTFRSSYFQYSFKYPSNWGFVECRLSDGGHIYLNRVPGVPAEITNIECPGSGQIPFVVSVKHSDFLKFQSTAPKSNETKTQLTIDGQPAIKFTTAYAPDPLSMYPKGGTSVTIISSNGTSAYMINFVDDFNFNDDRSLLATYDQILSTFKFTSSTSSVPADWKTYTNAEYGFEFRYPADFTVIQSGTTTNKSFIVTLLSLDWKVAYFTIMTQGEYKVRLADPNRYQPTNVIAQNATHVAGYTGPQECPSTETCQKYQSVINSISPTFKFSR